MARRKGLLHALAQAQREAERQQVAQLRAQTKAAQEAERARKAYLRSQERSAKDFERAQKQYEKEQAQLYVESRMAEVELKNEQLQEQVEQLNNLLTATLNVDDFFDLNQLKQPAKMPIFVPGSLDVAEPAPQLQTFMPPEPSGIKRFLPGAKDKHAQAIAMAQKEFEEAFNQYTECDTARRQALDEARARHDAEVAKVQRETAAQHAEIDALLRDLAAVSPEAIVNYFSLVLESSSYPDNFPQHAKLAYVPESKQLVVEYDLPSSEVVPEISVYKYTKAKDEGTTSTRSQAQ